MIKKKRYFCGYCGEELVPKRVPAEEVYKNLPDENAYDIYTGKRRYYIVHMCENTIPEDKTKHTRVIVSGVILRDE
jgi:hypothetical protein